MRNRPTRPQAVRRRGFSPFARLCFGHRHCGLPKPALKGRSCNIQPVFVDPTLLWFGGAARCASERVDSTLQRTTQGRAGASSPNSPTLELPSKITKSAVRFRARPHLASPTGAHNCEVNITTLVSRLNHKAAPGSVAVRPPVKAPVNGYWTSSGVLVRNF